MIEKLTNGSMLLEKALDAAAVRNEIISQNIANVDTPGYKRKTVSFEEHLSGFMNADKVKMQRIDSRHMVSSRGDLENALVRVEVDNNSTSVRLDGNNVDIDNEMASMAKNTIKYNTLVQRINSGFSMLKSVINEGRR
jgi:flagellar basal-body rod protein FlgB